MTTDILLPRTTDIIARALDIRSIAVHRADEPTVRQLDRLMEKLPFARLWWDLGTLVVESPSGGQYRVTRAGCSCPNGQKCDRRQCWHVCLFELLLDMFDTAVETADIEAEIASRPLGQRIASARAHYAYL